MTWVDSLIPGQISLANYIDVITPPGGGGGGGGGGGITTAQWNPGMYAKIEGYQMNYALTAGHAHMPNPYLPNSTATNHVNGIFGELDRKKWMKGILLELEWGMIESTPNTFNWTFVDFVFDTIRDLPKTTGQNKRVLLLINNRSFTVADSAVSDLLPPDLRTQPTANGGYYKNPTTFPPPVFPLSPGEVIVNAKKWDHLWCYMGVLNGSTTVQPKGYNMPLYKLAAAAGTNTFKTRLYAFITALATRYKDDPVLAGIVTTESAMGDVFVAFEAGNSRNAHYEGRFNLAKKIRELFPFHPVFEACDFDNAYYHSLTDAGLTDGLVANKIGFTAPDCHIGTNMNVNNINPVLVGKVPVMTQMQPLMMGSKTGNRPNYYNWPTNPTQILSGDGITWNDPPTAQFCMDRVKFFNSNYHVFQRNFDTSHDNATSGITQMNWPRWKTYMDASVYANDPLGGMVGTPPLFIS